jgi:hypothetical protein
VTRAGRPSRVKVCKEAVSSFLFPVSSVPEPWMLFESPESGNLKPETVKEDS